MKRGSEARVLRQVGGQFLQRTNAREVVGVVQWRQWRRRLDARNHIIGDATRLHQRCATMNNAVRSGGEGVCGDALRVE